MNYLFLDFESYYSKAEGYALKALPVAAYVRDSRFKAYGFAAAGLNNEIRWASGEECQDVLDLMPDKEWANTCLVGHNVKFDALILKHIYGKTAGQYIDTLAMSKAVLGKSIVGHQLADLAAFYGLEPKGTMTCEGMRDLTPEAEEALADYCKHDVWLTREIFNRLKADFPDSQYKLMDWTVRTFIEPKLILNIPLLKWAAEKERTDKAAQFAAIGVDKKVLGSNPQFAALLESYGYKVPFKQSPRAKDKDGKPKIIPAFSKSDAEFLNMLNSDDNKLRTLCEARLSAKSNIIETRADKLLLVGSTGKFAFDVGLSGADMTHRFSGGPGYGGNPQNPNRCQDPANHKEPSHECKGVLRKAVGVPADSSFIVCDAANIDLRFVAYLSGDRVLVDAFENGLDVYCGFASDFYGFTVTKANFAERFFGKTAELSLPYGAGWETFKAMVRAKTGATISEQEARRTVDLYRSKHSGVVAFWNFLESSIKLINSSSEQPLGSTPLKIGKGAVVLPSGLRIKFPNLRQRKGRFGKPEWCFDLYEDRHLVTNSLYGSFLFGLICQALAGEHCKEVAEQFLPWLTGFVHDETQLVAPKVLAPVLAKRMDRAMSTPPKWMKQIRLSAEFGIGQNWLEAK